MKLFEIHLTKFSWNWEEKRIFSLLSDNQIKMNWNVISLTINKANYMAIFNRRSILIQFESLPLKIFTCRKFVSFFRSFLATTTTNERTKVTRNGKRTSNSTWERLQVAKIWEDPELFGKFWILHSRFSLLPRFILTIDNSQTIPETIFFIFTTNHSLVSQITLTLNNGFLFKVNFAIYCHKKSINEKFAIVESKEPLNILLVK